MGLSDDKRHTLDTEGSHQKGAFLSCYGGSSNKDVGRRQVQMGGCRINLALAGPRHHGPMVTHLVGGSVPHVTCSPPHICTNCFGEILGDSLIVIINFSRSSKASGWITMQMTSFPLIFVIFNAYIFQEIICNGSLGPPW